LKTLENIKQKIEDLESLFPTARKTNSLVSFSNPNQPYEPDLKHEILTLKWAINLTHIDSTKEEITAEKLKSENEVRSMLETQKLDRLNPEPSYGNEIRIKTLEWILE